MTDSIRYAWRRLVVRDGQLTEATRRVLLELESYADGNGSNARPGIARIADALQTSNGEHVSERTVRRALAVGVERGFIECTHKGRRGRDRNSADVYRLTFPPEALDNPVENDAVADIQMSGNPDTNTGHPGVHQSDTTTGHLDTTSGHLDATTGHLNVHPPVHYTSPSTPESSHLAFSNAGASAHADQTQTDNTPIPADETDQQSGEPSGPASTPDEDPDDDTDNVVPFRAPTTRTTPTSDRDPLAWLDNELPGGYRTGERTRAKELLDAGMLATSIRFELLRARNARPTRRFTRRTPLIDNTKEAK